MANKRLIDKHRGGIKSSLGIDYEIRFAIKQVAELVLPTNSGVRIVKVKRQIKESVDDVFVEKSDKSKIYYQCKRYKKWFKSEKENQLWLDFFNQYQKSSISELFLITKNTDVHYEELANLARGSTSYKKFVEELKDSNAVQKKINYLISLIKQKDAGNFIYKFLKRFRACAYDDFLGKEDTINQFARFCSIEEAKNLFNAIYSNLNNEWLGKNITKKKVYGLLMNLNIGKDKFEIKESPVDVSKVPQHSFGHLLADANAKFVQKLDYLFKLINEDKSLSKDDAGKSLNIISADNSLSWHFLKNLNKPEWFPKIKDNVIKAIVEQEEDGAVKFQLLSYFEKCADKYSDEIIPLIAQLEKNTQNYSILSNLVETLGKLKPKQKKNISLLFEVFSKLTEHQHPWVRRAIPQALQSFAKYDIVKVLGILEKVFFYNPPPQDVTQGGPTLALTFQGRDNENWVFEEAMKVLSELLNDPKCADKALDLAIKVEIDAIKTEEKDHDVVHGITLDYSYIWLGDKSFEKLEYNHNRRERVILEVEKTLNEISKTNKKLASALLKKLLSQKYEVFYLAAIKTLTRSTSDFQVEAKSLVFDSKVWEIHNIRNYYLQNLITKYFKLSKGRGLKEFVKLVNKFKGKDNKRTLYVKQDLLISIPEKLRSSEVKKQLSEISKALKSKAKITKPFVTTSWSGPRPDINVEKLQKKNDDELIQIMLDSSAGKRAASYDIAPSFASLISQNPRKLKVLLSKMKDKKIAPDFAGEMTKAYIKKNPENTSDIADLLTMLSTGDIWARIELARYFNGICRKQEIQKYNQNLLKKTKKALFVLSQDTNPETDETIKSSNPRPDDAITRGINSVRGIATEALVAFSHYFPKDKEVAKRIKELADDKTNAVKATLIYYLRYLIGKNYRLCEEVVNKFRNKRDPEIDFALIHFFAQLDCAKLIGKKDFIKALFNNTNEQINEDLGKLIGYRYTSCCDVQDLVDEILGSRKGTKNTLRSLAFVFESQLGKLMGSNKATSVVGYLKKLLGPQNEFEVAERASFVFERDEIKPEHFSFIDENGLMDELISNQRNIPAQMHLVNYLYKCVEVDASIERCLEVLHEQVKTVEFLLSDHLIAKKISEIVNKLIGKKLDEQSKNYLVDIFDAGLERGWDEFYAIYNTKVNQLLK